jgi:hypothetical protein
MISRLSSGVNLVFNHLFVLQQNAECDDKYFGISAQQIVQCVYYGANQNRILDQSRLAIVASFLGQPIEPFCK